MFFSSVAVWRLIIAVKRPCMAYSPPYALVQVDHAVHGSRRRSTGLGIASGAALYVGAVLGPGVLLLPALAAQAAGPASVLAWVGLLAASLAIAATFAALGVRHPVAGGAAAYVRAAYGARAGRGHGLVVLRGRGGRRARRCGSSAASTSPT